MIRKQQTIVGLARATSASQQPAAPLHTFVCDSASITPKPSYYDRTGVDRDRLASQAAGFDHDWAINGMECSIEQAGWLFAMALGLDTITGGAHIATPADASQYVAAFIDTKAQVGDQVTETTEVGLGGKIGSLSLELSKKSFGKISASGKLCAMGSQAAALTRQAIPTAPISWHLLRAGSFKVGYGVGALTADAEVQSLKVDFSQDLDTESQILLANDQPSGVLDGDRELTFEFTRYFDGTAGLAAYNAQRAGQNVALEIKFTSGTSFITISVPNAQFVDAYAAEAGSGTDPVLGTVKCKAYKSGSTALVTVTTDLDDVPTTWTP